MCPTQLASNIKSTFSVNFIATIFLYLSIDHLSIDLLHICIVYFVGYEKNMFVQLVVDDPV